jgi:AcrR family transcriptional regulator
MRIIKEYDERKNEILDAAARLFTIKGYEKCTINDILKEVNIAKGTFYYYFKSKEEVMDEIIGRVTDVAVTNARAIMEKTDIGPEEKLVQVFLAMRMEGKYEMQMIDELHRPENALMHQKSLNQIVTRMAPILTKVVEEGMEAKIWNCKFPLEYMQIFLAASTTLMDEGMFVMDSKSQMKILIALVSLLEKMLDIEDGTYQQKMMQYWG